MPPDSGAARRSSILEAVGEDANKTRELVRVNCKDDVFTLRLLS